MNKENSIWVVIFWAAIIFGLMIFISVTGCNCLNPRPESITPQPTTAQEVIYKTIQRTDWLSSGFLICIVLGVFIGCNNIKAGWLFAIASAIGLFIKSGLSNVWMYPIMGIICIIGFIVLLITIFARNKALKEIITGIQKYKHTNNNLSNCLNEQSQSTKNIVKQVKETLNNKGE